MFIGSLVKLKSNIQRYGNVQDFVETAIKEDWIWLITGIDDEDIDYIIQPVYLDDDYNITQLGKELMVLNDEIEEVNLYREELFNILRKQKCIY